MGSAPVVLGSAWKREAKESGSTYYSGKTNTGKDGAVDQETEAAIKAWADDPTGFKLLVFPNDKKGNSKAPDIRILLAKVEPFKGFPDKQQPASKSAKKSDLF